MVETRYETPAGVFELLRYPERKLDPLRAWCSADTLLVDGILENTSLDRSALLVANDEYGALSVALQPVSLWTDSALARTAIHNNLTRNARGEVNTILSTDALPGGYSTIAMRVPKLLPYFEHQLATLAAASIRGTVVLAAGMDKHLSPRVAELMEQYIGPTQRHRGRLKARLFSATRDDRPPQPAPALTRYHCEPLEGELVAMASVFSRERLDIGSRFLIDNMGLLSRAGNLLDLACGNGVLGIVAARRQLSEKITFCDESAMAIASAQVNAATHLPDLGSELTFHLGDGLQDYAGHNTADLILCNPPFHANHTVDEFVGRRLLRQSAAHLRPGGQLCLVANRHLKYLPTLKRDFSRVDKLAQNSKFVIWLAIK